MKLNLISDIDGILSTGEHIYSVEGKVLKSFGSNDKDALKVLINYFDKIIFCSADVAGEEINKNNLKVMGDFVLYEFCNIESRQDLINKYSPCIYIGDGIHEPKALINICLSDSTPQAKENSDVVLPTVAGKNVFPHLLKWLESENIFKFVSKIKNALNGKIILTGVGKNYSLAQLVSEFFLPYNLVAVPLDANHSMHGSLGIIKDGDILIASSKSGNTRELLEMMMALQEKNPNFKNTFLITSNKNCNGKKYFEHVLVSSEEQENSLCGLSPQTTIEKYLKIYFQILNILNQDNNCTKIDYLLNHQGGTIGKTKI
jgi:D-arabinose 5-phosphate isomerase GutQ